MKKEVTNSFLVTYALPALNYLASKETTAWYRVKRNWTRTVNALSEYDTSLKAIQEKFMVDGKIPKKNQKEADKLYAELMSEKLTVDFDTIDIDHLNKTTAGLELGKFSAIIGIIIIDPDDVEAEEKKKPKATKKKPLKAVK